MTENRCIMSFFTHVSNFVVLANGSCTLIQGVGTEAITLTLFYHQFSIYLFFFLIFYQ